MENSCLGHESTLCNTCSVLRFNDKELVGHEAQYDNEEDILSFANEHGPRLLRPLLWLDYMHRDSLPELPCLRARAEAGCAFCAMLRSAALGLNFVESGEVTVRLYYDWASSDPRYGLCTLTANLRIKNLGLQGNFTERLVFEVDCEQGNCQKWLRTALTPWAETLCDENVAWMRQVLDRCNVQCGQSSTSSFLPTRLIDLGNNDQSGSFRLIESLSARVSPSNSYAALSYCWGPTEQAKRQLTTTLETLSRRLDVIYFDEMTPVMQDMVNTAQALSIRYIWIDALCIIQDDYNDWMYEAERMGSVYANAFVTICAISTTSCLDSFLDRRDPSVKVAFRSSIQPDIHGYLSLRPRRRRLEADIPWRGPTSRDRDLDCGAWSFRAWTLQEKEMSQRLLCFGAQRVHFSCSMQKITEMEHGLSESASLFSHKLQRYKQGEADEYIRKEWNQLIESYAYRQSTNPQDRFPAIGGLAKLMAEATQDTYVAGLWKGSLPQGLLWYTDQTYYTKEELLQRLSDRSPDTYIGPSWSWTHSRKLLFQDFNPARLENSPSTWTERVDFRSECHYLEATCNPQRTAASPYGRVENGKLMIGGKVIQPETQRWFQSLGRLGVTYGGCRAFCDLDWTVDYDEAEMENPVSLLLLLGSDFLDFRSMKQETRGRGSRVLQCEENCNMTSESVQVCELQSNRTAWGLLIHPIDNGARYVRVGRFQAGEVGALLPFMDRPFEDVEIV